MSSRNSNMATQLRQWAAEIEAADAEAIDLDPGITIAEAVRVLREASSNEYLSIRLDLTVHNGGRAIADWGTYVNGASHDTGHPTLAEAVKARLNLLRGPAEDAIESVDAALAPAPAMEATAGAN